MDLREAPDIARAVGVVIVRRSVGRVWCVRSVRAVPNLRSVCFGTGSQSSFCFVTAIIDRHRYMSEVFLVGRGASANEGGK